MTRVCLRVTNSMIWCPRTVSSNHHELHVSSYPSPTPSLVWLRCVWIRCVSISRTPSSNHHELYHRILTNSIYLRTLARHPRSYVSSVSLCHELYNLIITNSIIQNIMNSMYLRILARHPRSDHSIVKVSQLNMGVRYQTLSDYSSQIIGLFCKRAL